MPTNQLLIGPQTLSDTMLSTSARGGKTGETIVSELHGRYVETTYRRAMFYAANQTVATTTVGLATTYTGLCLSNPIGSNTVLALNKASIGQSVIETAVDAFGLAVGFSGTTNVVHTAAVTPASALIGSGVTPVGKVDTSATLPVAPVYHSFLQSTSSATTDVTSGMFDYEGSLILLPGAFVIWASPAASVAGMWFSFQWEELPA